MTSLASFILLILSQEAGAQSPPVYRYQHEPVPTSARDVAVAARGATIRADASPGRYHPLPIIDGDIWDANGHVYTAWTPGSSKIPHWVEITFSRMAEIDRVILHWPKVNGVYRSSTRYTLSAWVAGKWQTLESQNAPQESAQTIHTFAATTTRRIRIEQPAGAGHASSPGVLWLSEVEAIASDDVISTELPPNLLKAPVRHTINPVKDEGSRTLKTEGSIFIPGMKAVILLSSRSGISGKYRIYLTYQTDRLSSVQTKVGPIPPNGRFRSVIDLPDTNGRLKVVHSGWMGEGNNPEDITIEEIRVVPEAEPPAPWAIRDKALPWRWPIPNSRNVPLDSPIQIYLNDQIWKDSLTNEHFKLFGTDGEVPCKVTYEPYMRKVMLWPKQKLQPDTTWFACMSFDVRDLRGNHIHNRPDEWDGFFFSTGDEVKPSSSQLKRIGSGGIELVEWPVDLRVGWTGRVVVNVPVGTAELEVKTSEHLRPADRTPFDASRAQRKFYFVALASDSQSQVTFRTPQGAEASVRFPTLTLAEELSPRRSGTFDLPRRWPMGKELNSYKTQSINYPKEKIAGVRKKWIEADKSDADRSFPTSEQLFNLVPPSWMQRNIHVSDDRGCPVHGTEVHKFRSKGTWKIDPLNRPFQVQCRIGEEWYPSNKIAEGDFTSGEYPDDGFGCWIDGHCYHFIGYYNHWLYSGLTNWYGHTASGANHFKRTGEQIGARKAMILLYRLAEEYGHLAAKPADRMNSIRGTVHQHDTPARRNHLLQATSVADLRIKGMLRDNIWTCASFQSVCEMYDAIFEGLQDGDQELIDFLRSKNPDIRSMQDIRRFFEDNFIRVGVQMFFDRSVVGNEGAHQEALMNAALISDIPEASDIVDWVFDGPGQYRYKLANSFFKDGAAFESVSYNSGHVAKLFTVYDMLARLQDFWPKHYPASRFPVPGSHPKYRNIFRFPVEMCMLDGAVAPSIGDAGMPQHNDVLVPRPGGKMGGRRQVYLGLYRTTRDPLFAQVLYGNGNPNDPDRNRKRLLFDDSVLNAEVDRVIKTHGALSTFSSRLFNGYGLSVLRSGEGKDKRSLWMSWSSLRGHPHADKLQIGYAARQRNVMRCLGYPRLMQHFSRSAWTYNPFTHYKPHIWPEAEGYGTNKYRGLTGQFRPSHFMAGGPIQLVEAGSEGQHQQRRTAILIDVSPADSYVLDIVRLKGGRRHYLNVPGLSMHTAVTTSDLKFSPQGKGTVASKDIGHWETEKAKAHYKSHTMNGLAAFFNVSWSEAIQPWWIDWKAKTADAADLHLRYRQLPQPGTRVALADGEEFKKAEDDHKLRAAFTIREGIAPLTSQFVGTFEYYQDEPIIDSVKGLKMEAEVQADFKPFGLWVNSGDQEDIILVGQSFVLSGEYGIVSRRNGKLHSALLVGTELSSRGLRIQQKSTSHEAMIIETDYSRRAITIAPCPPLPQSLIGEYIRIHSEHREAFLRIESVTTIRAKDTCEIIVDADPLVGEGIALEFGEHQITTPQTFFLSGSNYYRGAILTDETGKTQLRLTKATRSGTLFIDRNAHPKAKSDLLKHHFQDGPDENKHRNLFIYDYAAGDRATIDLPARIRRTPKDQLILKIHQPVTLMLPSTKKFKQILPEGNSNGTILLHE